MREAKSLALAVVAALTFAAGCGGTSGQPAAPAAPAGGGPQPASPAESAAARELKANLDRFNLRIEYHGEQKGEPVHSLWLMVGFAPPYRMAPGWLVVSDLPRAQAARIVDRLEGSGLLRQGAINRAKLRALPAEPYYSWQVSGKPDDQYYGELGFDAEGYRQLEALSKVLDGEAAKAMQKLLARFAEKRGTWKPLSYEGISWGEPSSSLCLGLGPDQNPLGEKGTTLKVSVWYKNVGDKPVTVPQHSAPGVNMYRLMFAGEKDGKPFYIGFAFQRSETIGPGRRELKPGERFSE